jgi:hypothetical protein
MTEIQISSEQIERIRTELAGIKGGAEKAMHSVLNRAASTVRSQSSKHIRSAYAITHGELTKNSNIKIQKATQSRLEAIVTYAGHMIPLMKFNVAPKSPKRKTVSASVLKSGSRQQLKHAYVADLGKYGVGVFERETKERDSSKQLYGPSVKHMAEKEEVTDKVRTAALEAIAKRTEHEITRILNGYGGGKR